MSFQLNINFNPVHEFENNPQSQAVLDKHRDDFAHDCWVVLLRLLKGHRLTVRQAIIDNLTGHLPRRVLDLKRYGIAISSKWISNEANTRAHKEYFIDETERSRIYELLLNNAGAFKKNNGLT